MFDLIFFVPGFVCVPPTEKYERTAQTKEEKIKIDPRSFYGDFFLRVKCGSSNCTSKIKIKIILC